ncbi:MAG: fimbrillin family protein [Bacteroidaceae bacterium]|nr:fimbrillin family protein [Bacteroidaceae bacterium]
MKASFIIPAMAVVMLASCSSEEDCEIVKKYTGNVEITAESYVFEDSNTRTNLTNTGSEITFAWDNNEVIGIFPVAPTTNIQAKQVLRNKSGNNTSATFDGAGWALLYENTYAAYYPFQNTLADVTYDAVPISMTDQEQIGNNSLAHIGNGYDFMYAIATVPTNGNIHFSFKHVTSVLYLSLTMPDAATWKSLTITNTKGNNVFTTNATMNVANGNVTSVNTVPEITLGLKNVKTTTSNKVLNLYIGLLPTTPGEVELMAITTENKCYKAKVNITKTFVAGRAYKYTASPVMETPPPSNGYENGHTYVDLGLSVKWATMNVGASKPTDYGKYFAWGETSTKSDYDWDNYSYGDESYLTKYCTEKDFGVVDGRTTLELSDDAAHVFWGGKWRTPTISEMKELLKKCTWTWVSSYNGTSGNGYKVTGPNGNVIFLPAAGGKYSYQNINPGTYGYYWTSSVNDEYNIFAWYISFNSNIHFNGNDKRIYGRPIRAVCE